MRLALLLVLLAASANAQAPLQGEYGVGVGQDYDTIADAAKALELAGANGKVTFVLTDSNYDEQVTLGRFQQYDDPESEITFVGLNDPTWTYTSPTAAANWVLRLDGVERVVFRDIEFVAGDPAATYDRLVALGTPGRYLTFESCLFQGRQSATTEDESLVAGIGQGIPDDMVFRDNTFLYGYIGLELFEGSNGANQGSDLVAEGNTFGGQVYRGISVWAPRARIQGNTVWSGIWSDSQYIGIIVNNGDEQQIVGNDVLLRRGSRGISTAFGSSTGRRLVANNRVDLRVPNSGSMTGYSAYSDTAGNVDVVHNTFRATALTATVVRTRYGLAPSASAPGVRLRNNILVHDGGGVVLDLRARSEIDASDWNDVVTTGSTIAKVNEVSYATLAAYQSATGLDPNSVAIPVEFVDTGATSDLRLAGASLDEVSLVGRPVAGITLDADGDARDGYNPKMGADEGTPLPPLDDRDTAPGESRGYFVAQGPDPDFDTPQQALDALRLRRMKGPVRITIGRGTFPLAASLDGSLRVGDAVDPAFTPLVFRAAIVDESWRPTLTTTATTSATNYIVQIDGLEGVQFVNIEFDTSAGGSLATALDVGAGSAGLQVLYSRFTAPSAAGSFRALVQADDLDDAVFSFNEFVGGAYGIRMVGSATGDDAVIQQNTFTNQASRGLDVRLTRGTVTRNTFAASAANATAVRLLVGEGYTVTRNQITYYGANAFGLQLLGGTASASSPGLVANNVIRTDRPIQQTTTGAGRILHNTLFAIGNDAIPLTMDGAVAEASSNIYHSETGGTLIEVGAEGRFEKASDNVFSTTDPIRISDDGTLRTLAEWQSASGLEDDAREVRVSFVAPLSGDLHLAPPSDSDARLAVPVRAEVPRDFDDSPRGGSLTSAGADHTMTFAPYAGTYTVYGTSPDFSTLADAAQSLAALGVSGEVILELRPGTHVGQAVFTAIPGTSASSRVTIVPESEQAGVTLSYQATSADDNYIVLLREADYVTIGRIRFEVTGTTFARAVVFEDGANYNEVVQCSFEATSSSGGLSSSRTLVYAYAPTTATGIPNEFTLIAGNTFAGSTTTDGIRYGGSPPQRADGLVIRDNTATGLNTFLSLSYNTSPVVEDNEAVGTSQIGVMIGSGSVGLTLRRNRIVSRFLPLSIGNLDGTEDDPVLVSNNAFTMTSSVSTFNAVKIQAVAENVRFAHNSIHTEATSPAVSITSSSSAPGVQLELVGNIITSAGGSLLDLPLAAIATSENNLLYTSAAGPLATIDGTDYATLAAYQSATGLDAGSVSFAPTFADVTTGDLHLAGASVGDNRLGMAGLADVTEDFDGDARPAFTYRGADEAEAPLEGPAFAVTNPIEGDLYAWGDPINVRWTTLDPAITPADRVRISLVCAGQAPIVRFASAANTGAKGFLMPASVGTHGGPADPGGACQAEVALETDTAQRGLSAPFVTQDPARDVEVTEPDRFSRYGIGDPFTFRWDAADVDAAAPGSTVDLTILCPGRADLVAFTNRPNNGARGFLLPTDFGAYDGCHAQVAATADGTVFGRSPGFEVRDVPLPSVAITLPTSATTWEAGTTRGITWTTNSTDPTVEFRILLDRPGVSAPVRLAQTDNDGVFEWAIPSNQPTGGGYRIRMTGLAQDGSRIRDISELFAISAPANRLAAASATPLDREWTRVEPSHTADVAAWLAPLARDGRRVVARDGAGALLAVTEAGAVGDLRSADGAVDVWVDGPATLGAAPPASGGHRADPAHFAFDATDALARPAALWTVTAPGLADGDEIAVVTGDGTVVGRGVVSGGAAAVVLVGSETDLDDEASEVLLDAEPQPLGLRAWRRATGEEVDLDVASAPQALAFVSGAEWEVQTVAVQALAVVADAPASLTLEPVSPNPARGAARVRVGIPTAGAVVATVYDVRGRIVATLADGEQPAGWLDLDLDAGALAAGVYVVRVQTGAEQATRTMTVVR